jgi:hypothetical protein
MTDAERMDRLRSLLQRSGATVNDAFGIFALRSGLLDKHIAKFAGWADPQYLVAAIPCYFASAGPATAFVEMIRQSSPASYPAASQLEAAFFPSAVFCNPDWIPGRRLIAYTHQWYQLAEEWQDFQRDERSVVEVD